MTTYCVILKRSESTLLLLDYNKKHILLLLNC